MKVSGFTIVRNAIKYDYPIAEAIQSVLPLCNEFIVAVGKSEDDTLSLIQNINSPKIKIVETVWNDALRDGGKVLADETNKAMSAISAETDWCFYIQGDEVLHEKYLQVVADAMQEFKDEKSVDGLLFNYLHFYGSYDYVADSPKWYSKEIRIVKNNVGVFSWGDAQGFRKGDNEKLCVKQIDAFIHHYGWVKDPFAQQRKQENFHKMWHSDDWVDKNVVKADSFDYSNIDSVKFFEGTHPAVIQGRVSARSWKFDFDPSKASMKLRYRIRKWLKEKFGLHIGEYRNYKLV
jgi:hypothetical protein